MSLLRPNPVSVKSSASSQSVGEFTHDERSLLLRLAHDSIVSALESRAISFDPPSPHLAEPRGVFTSLYLPEEPGAPFLARSVREKWALRGCVGYVLPAHSVYRAVAETACAAAFEDTRFSAVTREEAPHLAIELSILSPPQPIVPEAIEIGRHGLLISMTGHRGLLLPQVPIEHHWDRITFLEQTCRKAGLPLDAWQSEAKIEAFTAEVFGEKTSL
jgi:AmmeMemoRadiSam system protein A